MYIDKQPKVFYKRLNKIFKHGKQLFFNNFTCMSNLVTYIGSPRNFNNG
jgi:hypothetical protein